MSDGWDGWDESGGPDSGGYRRPRRRGSARGVRADDAYGYGQDDYGSGYEGSDGYADDGPGGGYGGGDPYASGGYAAPDGYGADAAYGGQDGYGDYGGYEASGGYEPGGGYDGQDDGYGWRDSGPGHTVDDPGLARRRSGPEGSIDADSPRHDGFFRGFGGGDAYLVRRSSRPRARPVRRKSSHAGLVALAIVVIIFAGIAGVGYHYYGLYKSRHAVFTGNGFGSVTILVSKGDTFDSISAQLLHKGVIAAIDPWAAFVQNRSASLQPGAYRIHKHMSLAATYAALTNLKNLVKVVIPEGLPLVKLLPKLASQSGIPLSQFQAAAKQTSQLGLPAYAHGKLEGYLFPATYPLVPGETALQILKTAVSKFNSEMTSIHLVAIAKQKNFNDAGEVITGASLLEAEVGSEPKYFGPVARVIDNRLNANMDLQLDSTVAYATGKFIFKLTSTDLAVNSPYNTFTHSGMPPGPINSPDLQAILAFLNPPHNNFLYFVTVNKQGLTRFTSSFSQFQTWQAEAKRNGLA